MSLCLFCKMPAAITLIPNEKPITFLVPTHQCPEYLYNSETEMYYKGITPKEQGEMQPYIIKWLTSQSKRTLITKDVLRLLYNSYKQDAKIKELTEMVSRKYLDEISLISNDAYEMGRRINEIKRLKDKAGDELSEELKEIGLNPFSGDVKDVANKILNQLFDGN